LAVPIWDAGFVQGATVAEQLRTFRGRLFRQQDHLKRLFRSLEIVQVEPGYDEAELSSIVCKTVDRNRGLLTEGDDLGAGIFVTPGPYSTLEHLADGPRTSEEAVDAANRSGPIVCVYTYPLPFAQWAEKYEHGESLVTSDIRQVPTQCWPAELKCRSRMHYFLADCRARSIDPHSRAVLLDEDGCLNECSTANVVVYFRDEGLVSPPRSQILPGISLMQLAELADQLGIPFSDRPVSRAEIDHADEILLTSTSACLLPVTRLDGRTVGSTCPGEICRRLLAAWSAEVGVDIPQQARRFSSR
jgi:branched-subunit amino acid aminotransferase/4-amino-4-deoxychorismate lyase